MPRTLGLQWEERKFQYLGSEWRVPVPWFQRFQRFQGFQRFQREKFPGSRFPGFPEVPGFPQSSRSS
jgi:hypothetical protein